ncbi:MAG: DUF2231 domain-containing protein [Syntrophobacteraceae bacterium]|nr:hypothetical protein [Desulfobacteraceae bacterium]
MTMLELDPEELARYDGKDGKPVYIAHAGRVYDVSESRLWKGGLHMRRHHAGKDLTTDIGGAPHGTEVLERYPQVGVVRKAETEENRVPDWLAPVLRRFPMARRHLHPMTVHFPIVFMLAATFFNLLHLVTGVGAFETTGLHCLGAGLVFTPVVMLTGLFTWWLNYLARPTRPVTIKIFTSIVLLLVALGAFTWRLEHPGIPDSFSADGVVYFLLILSLTPLVTVIGWHGAMLTFPIEKEPEE